MVCRLGPYLSRLAKEYMQPDDSGHYGKVTTVPEYKGPAPSLSRDFETAIRVYIEDCWFMGMPRFKGNLANDIQQYLNRKDMYVEKFQENKPGKT